MWYFVVGYFQMKHYSSQSLGQCNYVARFLAVLLSFSRELQNTLLNCVKSSVLARLFRLLIEKYSFPQVKGKRILVILKHQLVLIIISISFTFSLLTVHSDATAGIFKRFRSLRKRLKGFMTCVTTSLCHAYAFFTFKLLYT